VSARGSPTDRIHARIDALFAEDRVIERTFGEIRRRARVIGRSPGETSCLSLVWAVLTSC